MTCKDNVNHTRDAEDDHSGARSTLGTAFSLFEGAPEAVIGTLSAHMEVCAYAEGDTVLAGGQDDGTTLYGVLSGELQSTRGLAMAGDIDVTILSRGDSYGLVQTLSEERVPDPSVSLVARTACEVAFLDGEDVQKAVSQSRSFAQALLRAMSHELNRAQRSSHSVAGPERRLYQVLRDLVVRRGEDYVIDPMPRHAALADLAGISEKQAAEAIAMLLSQKVLYRDYPIVLVNDMERLRQLGQ